MIIGAFFVGVIVGIVAAPVVFCIAIGFHEARQGYPSK